jgi:hypothetical protein
MRLLRALIGLKVQGIKKQRRQIFNREGEKVEEGKKNRRFMYQRTVGSSAPYSPSWLNFLIK